MIFFTAHNTSPRLSGGYTVIELIVSMALFLTVVLMAIGAFLGVLSSNKKTLASRTALDNLNFALESMTRDMKTGFNYHCGTAGNILYPRDCTDGDSYIVFEGQSGNPDPVTGTGDQVVYRLRTNALGGWIERSADSGTNFFPITAAPPELSITGLAFRVYNSSSYGVTGNRKQPRILIVIRGVAGVGLAKSPFDIQTSISQRLPDT